MINEKKLKELAIPLEQLLSGLTDEEKKYVEEEKKYYKIVMAMRAKRKKMGMTQEKLAMKANLPRTTITKVESGSRNTTLQTLMNIAHAMDSKLIVKFI
jgi:DNA-binding XRE family transcriptional regulator